MLLLNVMVVIFPRKRKLLEKQKKGKKRMRQVGNVEIPQGCVYGRFKAERLGAIIATSEPNYERTLSFTYCFISWTSVA